MHQESTYTGPDNPEMKKNRFRLRFPIMILLKHSYNHDQIAYRNPDKRLYNIKAQPGAKTISFYFTGKNDFARTSLSLYFAISFLSRLCRSAFTEA